jgi:hypothetical protein
MLDAPVGGYGGGCDRRLRRRASRDAAFEGRDGAGRAQQRIQVQRKPMAMETSDDDEFEGE